MICSPREKILSPLAEDIGLAEQKAVVLAGEKAVVRGGGGCQDAMDGAGEERIR